MSSQTAVRVDEHSYTPLAQDVILPTQFYPALARRYTLRGEHRLLLAILEDAVAIYRGAGIGGRPCGRRGLRQIREAEEWIWSDDCAWVFSFQRICEALQLDPDYLRRGLRESRRRVMTHARAVAQRGPEQAVQPIERGLDAPAD